MTTAVPRARQTALGAYRLLLRSVAQTFKGDESTLLAAKKEIRQKFEDSRGMSDEKARSDLIYEAYDAAEFIKTHVVQAELNEEGHYKMAASQQMAEDQPPEGWVEPPPQKCS
ncbi:mitochondrial zinc maintenance protein [Chloropicon roscoffensis]|uniref:Mitochondrial zinc maintenance protein n=1 Tax=Chloropicon roscoffensis TaxID=1461544 RepID=A0AAX4NYF6_9CHLO|mmetsp:Transcript_11284/g.34430  ORF Transcript_11284/g.34430 Transcript_11284/m.34430 type:complete len:113 (-) Transcript_11284:1868-2206(-)